MHSRVDLLVKDNDGHTPHDLANLFQNTKCSLVAKPGAGEGRNWVVGSGDRVFYTYLVPPGAVLSLAVSSNSYLKVQTVPYGRSSSGSEGDRISGGGSPKVRVYACLCVCMHTWRGRRSDSPPPPSSLAP